MSSVINNISSMVARRNLELSNKGLGKTINRLSTGLRINQASDDAAGLAISNRLRADIKVQQQAVRNANDGISIISVADGALEEVANLLTRAAELAEQAASDTSGLDNSQSKLALDDEYKSIQTELDRLSNYVKFNGRSLFGAGGTSFDVKVGEGLDTVITIQTSSISTTVLGIGTDNLQTRAAASAALDNISNAINTVSRQRGRLGAVYARFETTISTLNVTTENLTAAESQVRDADVSQEVISLTKYQILTQSGTAALAQANAAAQNVLQLLR